MKINIHHLLISLLVLFTCLSSTNLELYGEVSILEISQALILVYALFISIRLIKLFEANNNGLLYKFRCVFLGIILYEEISFLTEGLSPFFNSNNLQDQINIHSLNFMAKPFIENLYLPILDYNINITYEFILYTFLISFISFGSFIPKIGKLSILCFEKKYAFYAFLFILNPLTIPIGKSIYNLSSYNGFVNGEFIELLIYFIFILDTLNKASNMKRFN